MKVEARWQRDMHFKYTSPSQHTIDIDSGPKGTTIGPGPMEVMLHAVACCSGMDIVYILRKKRKEPESFTITVEADRSETHPKKFKKINIHYELKKDGLTEKDVEQAITLSMDKYCPVIATLTPTVKIKWDFALVN